jgi:hypothetical protein
MVTWATGDGPHAFSACSFLLRTLGGWEWRLPKDDQDDDDPHGTRAGGVVVYIPDNGREDTNKNSVATPPTIDAKPTEACANTADETKPKPEHSEGWKTTEI